MYIKVGRLMSRNVVKKLLRAVPSEDLKGLKSICVRTVPHKATKKHNKRWGGIHGQYHESKVWIYLWSITYNTLKKCSYRHSNLYDYFIQNFAKTLYHEIGHHVHSKTEEYKALDARLEKMGAKMRRMKLKTKPMALPNGDVVHVYTDEYLKIKKECDSLHNKIEHFADEYAGNVLSKAREMNLLEAPHPTDIRFFKIMRDKFIDSWFKIYEEFKKQKHKPLGLWTKMMGVFDHLRKCKLGNGVKYNLREIFLEVYGPPHPERNELRRFKRFVLKHVTPFWYISRQGRKYAYFTEAQMNELKRRKPEFTRHCDFHRKYEMIKKKLRAPAPKKMKEPEDIALSHTLWYHRLVLWSLNCRLLFIHPFEDWGWFIHPFDREHVVLTGEKAPKLAVYQGAAGSETSESPSCFSTYTRRRMTGKRILERLPLSLEVLSGRRNSLKPLNGLDFEKEDVCEVIFSHKKTVKACRLFLDWLRTMGGEASRPQVSSFASELASGHVSEGFTYKRSNFYRTVLKKLMALGFISLQPRFDPEKRSGTRYVYAPIRQSIPKRPPLGGRSFWMLAWEVAKQWNEEFER